MMVGGRGRGLGEGVWQQLKGILYMLCPNDDYLQITALNDETLVYIGNQKRTEIFSFWKLPPGSRSHQELRRCRERWLLTAYTDRGIECWKASCTDVMASPSSSSLLSTPRFPVMLRLAESYAAGMPTKTTSKSSQSMAGSDRSTLTSRFMQKSVRRAAPHPVGVPAASG
jgi:hypothetical protein